MFTKIPSAYADIRCKNNVQNNSTMNAEIISQSRKTDKTLLFYSLLAITCMKIAPMVTRGGGSL